MPLLEAGRIVEDAWATVADDESIAGDRPVIISLARLQADEAALAGRNAPLGVLLPSNAKPEAIAALLPRLALVAVEFPKYRDGRGFTIARTLRERYGFAGEIRAVGAVLPDQHAFLLRCGFTTVVLPPGQDAARWAEALDQIQIAYQPAITDDQPLSLLRRHVARPPR